MLEPRRRQLVVRRAVAARQQLLVLALVPPLAPGRAPLLVRVRLRLVERVLLAPALRRELALAVLAPAVAAPAIGSRR